MCSVTMGLMAGSTLMEGMAQKKQYQAQAAANRADAAIKEENARLARAQAEDEVELGKFEENRLRQKTDQLRGVQKTAIARSGTEATGSAAEILDDTNAIEAEDVAVIKTNAQRNKWGFMQEGQNLMQGAELDRVSARNAEKAGNAAMMTSVLSTAKQVGGHFATKSLTNNKVVTPHNRTRKFRR